MSFPSDLRAPASWARCLVLRLWSRRLTEPPRPAYVGFRLSCKVSGPKGWRGRSESCQTGSVHRLASADAKSPLAPSAEGAKGTSPMRPKHEKSDGNHHRIFTCPHAACPRRLCQPPWTHASPSEPHPPHRRNHLCRSTQLKRQPLFGRGGLGERGFSQRSRLSPRIFHPNLFERGFGGECFSIEKCSPPKYLTLSLFSEVVYAAGVGLLVFAAHTDGGNDEDDAGHEEGQHREEG